MEMKERDKVNVDIMNATCRISSGEIRATTPEMTVMSRNLTHGPKRRASTRIRKVEECFGSPLGYLLRMDFFALNLKSRGRKWFGKCSNATELVLFRLDVETRSN
ncbi:hypothetical protein ACH5RR_001849 [Cinchona calisaya]|uniref:Uncharacterized protein n=1 Tax=Cinchona calisaya TaxID=153742 RepID=A0ABD3B575_9GENT